MRDTNAWLQHQAGYSTDWNMGPYSALIDQDKGPINNVQVAALNEDD
jgi:hypothetical protein